MKLFLSTGLLFVLALTLALVPLSLSVAEGVAASLPVPVFMDGEADVHFPASMPEDGRSFLTRISFDATVSNTVRIAVGNDRDGDGVLSLREGAVFAGWERGEWFARRATTSGWERVSMPGSAGRHVLKLRRRSRDISSAEIAALEIDGRPSVFAFPKEWLPLDALEAPDALVRVTSRGGGGSGEIIHVVGSALVGSEADSHVISVR